MVLSMSVGLVTAATPQAHPESQATPNPIADGQGQPPVTAVVFSPDATSIVAVSQRGIAIHDWPNLRQQRTVDVSMSNVHTVSFSPNGKLLAVGGGYPAEAGIVQVFSWPDGKTVAKFDDHDDSVRAVVWLNDVNLITASRDRSIKQWNLSEEAFELNLEGHSRSVDALAMLDDGRTLVSAGADQSLRVWDLQSGTQVRSLSQHTQPVHALAIRPQTTGLPMVASAANDRTIRFWQPTIGRMMRYVRLPANPLSIVWTQDGGRLIAACDDGHVRIIDPVKVTVTRDIPVLESWAYALAIHPKGGSVVIAGTDGVIHKRNLRETKNRSAIR